MSREMRPQDACEMEDRVISAFLDGEPADDLQEVAAHLETCRRCGEVLGQARSLDALLASQTRTDISEETADRLLAAVAGGERISEATAVRPVVSPAPWKLRPLLAAAALIMALLVPVIWILLSSESPVNPDLVTRTHELPAKPLAAGQETSSPVEENAVEENAASFALPVGVGMFTWTERKKTFSDEEIKARLQGDRVPGLTREILLTHVLRLLDPETWKKDDAVSPADGPLTSRQDLALLATRWLLANVRRGLIAPGRSRVPGRILLRSRGQFRRELVDLLRAEERFTRRLAASWRSGKKQREVIELIGALGRRDQINRLQNLPPEALDACVAQARRTGDRISVEFLVDLYLESASRFTIFETTEFSWFSDLSPRTESMLIRVLEDRARSSRRKTIRDICERMHESICKADQDLFCSTRIS